MRKQLASLALLAAITVGCDGGGDADDAMVLRPVEKQDKQQAARPATADPTTRPSEEFDSAFITVTNADGAATTREFPPAKLWLKGLADAGQEEGPARVRAMLFSDDPAEALSREGLEDSFHFEMDLALPPEAAARVADRVAAGEAVSPADLARAEWAYQSSPGEPAAGRSGIYLAAATGGERHLRPADVLVAFDPLGDEVVIVTLFGDFVEVDEAGVASAPRRVQVRAVLTAEAIRR